MTILIDADGCPGVSDVMKNKTSCRTLPLIRLNLRLWRRWWAFSHGLIACGLRAAALFSSTPSLPQKRHQPGVAVHKTGFEKQILWQLPDKGC